MVQAEDRAGMIIPVRTGVPAARQEVLPARTLRRPRQARVARAAAVDIQLR